jgi:hypothetical protein
MTIDWLGKLYVGSHLYWDYINRTIDISINNYVAKAHQLFNHAKPTFPQPSPQVCATPHFCAKVQLTLPPDDSPHLSAKQVTHLQQVIETVLYYARAVDNTMLVTLGRLAAAQSKAITATTYQLKLVLDYASTDPDDKVLGQPHDSEHRQRRILSN